MSLPTTISSSSLSYKFNSSFFLFGLVNNVIYVVILSAALDLVDKNKTPKGLILLVNVLPSLMVKIGWPYFVTGPVRYNLRIVSCSFLSFLGILVVAFSPTLPYRLLGIAIASFSSGLGEMTYLQLATVYGSTPWHIDLGGVAVGWWSSGTGAAGLVGAGLWWLLRGLGVRIGLGVCSSLPLGMTLTYYLVLPPLSRFVSMFQAYEALPIYDVDSEEEEDDPEEIARIVAEEAAHVHDLHLSFKDKMELAKPLIKSYMLPLFLVYFAEYTINSGVAPTLLYAIPSSSSPILHYLIKGLRDYYPLYQLLYQLFVFFSRSSLSLFHLPPLPKSLLPLPSLVQAFILLVLFTESSTQFLVGAFGESGAIRVVMCLIAVEGVCGGSAYVNTFYRLGIEEEEDEFVEPSAVKDPKRKTREKEFRIASVGFSDTLGIVLASLVASAIEPRLCDGQVERGRRLCEML